MYNNSFGFNPMGNNFQMPTMQQNSVANMMNNPIGSTELIRVTGIEGAKAYPMQPNSTVALFDNGEDIFYVKSTDGAGFPTIKTFRFLPIETPAQATADFISRAEFEEFKQEVLINGKQSISKRNGKQDKSSNDE